MISVHRERMDRLLARGIALINAGEFFEARGAGGGMDFGDWPTPAVSTGSYPCGGGIVPSDSAEFRGCVPAASQGATQIEAVPA